MTGSYLLFKLLEKGYNITALKRKSSNTDVTEKIFKSLSKDGENLFYKINWITGDLSDVNTVYELVRNADYVYHTAATVSFKPSDRKRMIYENVCGTANIVNASLKSSVKKMCHVSSVAALGKNSAGKPLTEEIELTDMSNSSDYAISKFKSEREVWRGIAEGLNAVIVNPSIILGTGDWRRGSPRLIKTVWDGMKYYTKGINGFVDVRDVVNIMIKLTESNISAERFILNSENLSYRELFNEIADNLNKKRPSVFANDFMLYSLMYLDSFVYFFTGKEPRLTKYTVNSARSFHACSNKKVKKTLNYEFIPVKKSVRDFCKIFLKEINSK